jgi:hypothetical protein
MDYAPHVFLSETGKHAPASVFGFYLKIIKSIQVSKQLITSHGSHRVAECINHLKIDKLAIYYLNRLSY